MKRIVLAVFLIAGCSLPDRAFVDAVDKSWQAIGPEYADYVRADTTLDEDTRTERLETAAGFAVTIAKAKMAVSQ